VLADDKAGHTTQSVGLAEALGWPYEVKPLHFWGLNRISNRLLGASRVGLDMVRSATLAPPWPDVVISTGRRAAPVARWIGKQSRGRARLVQLGRKGGDMADSFDVAITCEHFRLPIHPRRIETVVPLHSVTPERLEQARKRWPTLFGEAPHPHIVLVVGGTSAMHELNAETAVRMGREVRAFAEQAGGTLFAITSPRTGEAATRALCEGLGGSDRVQVWKKGETENPYLAYLAHADVLVVTGESESMLAEATAPGKPLYIYPLPAREHGPRLRFSEWVTTEANRRRVKDKGTVRPQQGREYLCARLIERGFVRPPRDLDQLHEGLVRIGVARMFGDPLDAERPSPLHETENIAERVRESLGFYESTASEAGVAVDRQESQGSAAAR
jgi:mitochondrial fission protein ELM1